VIHGLTLYLISNVIKKTESSFKPLLSDDILIIINIEIGNYMPSLRSKQSWPLGVNKGPNLLMLTKRGQTQMLGHVVGDYFYTPDVGKDKWEVWALSDLTLIEAGIVTFDPEGAKSYPNTSMVEDLLGGVGILCFPDNTVQFAENETYPDVVYSPRLTNPELEQFCLENLAEYERYFETNRDAIDKGDDLPPIEQFWIKEL
jgi:hypothetical protein